MDNSKRKLTITVIIILLVIFVLAVGLYLFRTTKIDFGFAKVKVGDKKELVTNLMGQPAKNVPCNIAERQRVKDVNCYEIFAYYSLFSYWSIAFDENGKVVKKFNWSFDDGYGKPNEIEMLY